MPACAVDRRGRPSAAAAEAAPETASARQCRLDHPHPPTQPHKLQLKYLQTHARQLITHSHSNCETAKATTLKSMAKLKICHDANHQWSNGKIKAKRTLSPPFPFPSPFPFSLPLPPPPSAPSLPLSSVPLEVGPIKSS